MKAADDYQPTNEEWERIVAMIVCLRDNRELCKRLAKKRGWEPETLQVLASESCLGWHEQKLAFIYRCGVKLRWRHNGERIIRWAFGKSWVWRAQYLGLASRTKVFLCEGETDCISLLDAGAENDPEKICVALPSASSFNAEWAPLFAGKDVTLCFDNDEAGNAATNRVAKMLHGTARTVLALDWKEIQRAC